MKVCGNNNCPCGLWNELSVDNCGLGRLNMLKCKVYKPLEEKSELRERLDMYLSDGININVLIEEVISAIEELQEKVK